MSSTHSFYSNCGCLHSEQTSVVEKFSVKFLQDLQHNDKSYSKTCLQNVSNTDSLKTIFLSKESIHVEKLNTLRKRMLISLSGIQSLLRDRPQADGVEDLMRREQRAAEFSSRFCRNYLYPLQRQMNIIAKMWKNLQINHTHSAFLTLCQKVIATHQNAQAALNAYLHHIPSSVEKGIPEKLEELLQLIHNLCSICSMLGMSKDDSDFNSDRVKLQCQMLMMLIKTEVSNDEEGGESCTALSRTCSLKETATNSKKGSSIHRFSMYSRNTLQKSSSHQNHKITRISVASKKKSSKLHTKKQTMKEFNTSTDSKPNQLLKDFAHKSQEKDIEDNCEIGEVCANDDVKTMMEFLISEEVSNEFSVPLKRMNSKNYASLSQKELERMNGKKTSSSFLKELEKTNTKKSVIPTAIPSMTTLKKLESEIKNLKKQVKYLKEIDHPNYPIYLKALEVMSHQLTRMKEQLLYSRKKCKQVSNTSTYLHKPKEIEITKEVRGSLSKPEFPKNVKLICLSRMSDDEPIYEQEFLEKSIENIDVADSAQQEDFQYNLQPDDCLMQKARNNFQGSELIEGNRKSKDASSVTKATKRQYMLKEFSEIQSEENLDLHESDHLCRNSQVSGNGKEFNNSVTTDSRKVTKLFLPQSEVLSAVAYQQAFQKYMKSSSLYEVSIKPWLIVERLANNLMDNILEEITLNDTGIQKITSGLLQLEFQ